AERLAHRCPAEAEPAHQLALVDDRPRREVERDDPLADRVVRLVRERLLVRKARPVDVEGRRAHGAGEPCPARTPRGGQDTSQGYLTCRARPSPCPDWP